MSKTILIAEDEPVLRESLAELLAEEGYEVLQAAHGKEAYDLVLQRPVDLVLTDVRMPEMDGMELLQHLRKLAPETPVIMLTAYGTVQSAVAAMQQGASDYLLKPVLFEDVLLKIRR
ncbi:MAG TPA: response regulator, partial [Phycisphaerae bacterium]|nr:response regulator [Phycisphaerae bacterium]